MYDESRVTVRRVTLDEDRRRVIEVLAEIYHREKQWVNDAETEFPPGDLQRSELVWFLVTVEDRAAGALRIRYDPPYAQYLSYELELVDPKLRVEEFIQSNRIAEVGRFAVRPEFRGQFMVAAALMRAATDAVVARGYTHLVTDVFEDDPHTPYRFHTRVIGFCPVATHQVGELNCRSRRITLVLDISTAYERLRNRGHWLYRYLTCRWDELSHRRLAQQASQNSGDLAKLLQHLRPAAESRTA